MARDRVEEFVKPEGANPMEAARRGMRPALPKRFYKGAGVEEKDGGFALLLDGKTARTPARKPLTLPTRALAEAIIGEDKINWPGVFEFCETKGNTKWYIVEHETSKVPLATLQRTYDALKRLGKV